MYIERNNWQLELKRCRKNVDFIHVYLCEAMDSMQYRPPNAIQEVSIVNHFGSVSDSLGPLAAASECMASDKNIILVFSLLLNTYMCTSCGGYLYLRYNDINEYRTQYAIYVSAVSEAATTQHVYLFHKLSRIYFL